jgi:hypothetical protein
VRPTRALLAVIALGSVLLPPASASAGTSSYQRVLRAYEHAGTIPACQFSSSELQAALAGVDTYGAQYFADFTQAVQNALSTRAAGACLGRSAGSTSPRDRRPAQNALSKPVRSGPGIGLPAHLGSLTAASDGSVPAPLVVLGVLALIGVLGGGAALARRLSHSG